MRGKDPGGKGRQWSFRRTHGGSGVQNGQRITLIRTRSHKAGDHLGGRACPDEGGLGGWGEGGAGPAVQRRTRGSATAIRTELRQLLRVNGGGGRRIRQRRDKPYRKSAETMGELGSSLRIVSARQSDAGLPGNSTPRIRIAGHQSHSVHPQHSPAERARAVNECQEAGRQRCVGGPERLPIDRGVSRGSLLVRGQVCPWGYSNPMILFNRTSRQRIFPGEPHIEQQPSTT
jgi:hypothetical protein